jgi:photosystem II stability/assembly factor-like uncharacterized protein
MPRSLRNLTLRSAAVAALLAIVVCVALVGGQESGKRPGPLTEADVIALIGGPLDDQAVIGRIEKYKLAFQIDDTVLARIKQAHPSPAVLAALAKRRDGGPAITARGTWVAQNSGVTDDLYGVAFIDDRVGVAVGANKTILRTTDGGKSWVRVGTPKKGVDIVAVVFGNATVGWARANCLLHTTDGGLSWQERDNPGPEGVFSRGGFQALAAVGNLCFYQNGNHAIGGNYLSQTVDGKKWTDLWGTDGTLGGSGISLAFPTARDGWMASVSSTVPHHFFVGRSRDGGKTWEKQQIKEKVAGNHMLISAAGKDHGWFCSQFSSHVFASTDGGKIWVPYELSNGRDRDIAGLQFIDAKVGHVLCGGNWHVRQTIDGGKTWRSLGSLPHDKKAPEVHGLHFRSVNQGWVVGKGGYIARYSAGK